MRTSRVDRIAAGRRHIRQYHVSLLLISAGVIAEYWLVIGTDRWIMQVTRFVLTIGLLSWVYAGSQFARRLTIALCWFTGAAMVPLALRVYHADWLSGLSLGVNDLTYLFYTRALLWSEPIKEFLDSQRAGTLR